MIGKEKTTASGLVLPDMRHPVWQHVGKTGELPPIAGGAAWDLTVPQKRTEGLIKPEVGIPFAIPEFSLLQENSPTIMEEWNLANIRIPCSLTIRSSEEKNTGVFAATAIIRRSGSIVWSQSIEGKIFEKFGKVEINVWESWANFIFADNLINPIHLTRGSGLTLEISAEYLTTIGAVILGTVLYSSSRVTSVAKKQNETANVILDQGNIQYESRRLSGHRTL